MRINKVFKKLCITIILMLLLSNYITYRLTKYVMENKMTKIEQNVSINAEKDETANIAEERFGIDPNKVKDIKNVMIVAHPDDETLWGGKNLLDEKYLVICLTNGDNEVRKKEFLNVMKETDDYGIILNYPDKVNNVKSDWKGDKEKIRKDISYILTYKKWDKIVTHNPEGEYGHIHHKLTNNMVTEECIKKNLTNQLMYFSRYYKKNVLSEKKLEYTLSDKESDIKNQIMQDIYKSQNYAYESFKHMIPYEKFISYKNWNYEI